jgi:hypothetical protein
MRGWWRCATTRLAASLRGPVSSVGVAAVGAELGARDGGGSRSSCGAERVDALRQSSSWI